MEDTANHDDSTSTQHCQMTAETTIMGEDIEGTMATTTATGITDSSNHEGVMATTTTVNMAITTSSLCSAWGTSTAWIYGSWGMNQRQAL